MHKNYTCLLQKQVSDFMFSYLTAVPCKKWKQFPLFKRFLYAKMRTPVIYVKKTDFSPFKAFLYIVFTKPYDVY